MAIYFIQAADRTGLIKIGFTSGAIRGRLGDIQCMCPIQLACIAYIEDGLDKETEIHERFDEYRMHGEWFRPEKALLDFIASNAKQVDIRRTMNVGYCKGITHKGEPCTKRGDKTGFCRHHIAQKNGTPQGWTKPQKEKSTQCNATAISGHRCKRPSMKGAVYCYSHI